MSSQEYVPPSLTLPPTPKLPSPRETGHVSTLPSVNIWYALFGAPLEKTKERGIPPLLFLHGAFANSDYWGHQISFLLKGNDNDDDKPSIIAVDSRMHGRSSGLDAPISYDLMTQDVITVLDHFNLPSATVVGWSDGAIIGLDLAIKAPNRLHRLFAFAGQYSYKNANSSADSAPVFLEYFSRCEEEFRALSTTPEKFQTLFSKLTVMLTTSPTYTQSDFGKIPQLSQDGSTAPLIWIVDGADEEVVNRDVPQTMHNWIQGSGLVILPSVSHFA